MSFTLDDIPRVLERHLEIRDEDAYQAFEITEAAARYVLGQTECSRQDLEQALHADLGALTEDQQHLVVLFYGFVDQIQ